MKKFLVVLLLLSAPFAFAGRDFDGANDEISLGSDASIDDFNPRSICYWVRHDAAASVQVVAAKGPGSNEVALVAIGEQPRFSSDWTTDGNWVGTTDIVVTGFHHICITYDHGATTNDPIIYVDGAVETLTVDTAPTGSWVADAGNELQLGETNADALDLDGNLSCFVFHSAILTAADVNRARWNCRPMGGMAVYHPFWTTKLANEGTATANGTATGTTVASSPVPSARPGFGFLSGIGF